MFMLFWCNVFHYRNITPDQKFGVLLVFSLRLALWMEIIGFSVRFLSSFLWIQMYRLGVATVANTIYRADYSVTNSFVNPPTSEVMRQNSNSDEILGGSIYDPAYYSSLFEDSQEVPEVFLFVPSVYFSSLCIWSYALYTLICRVHIYLVEQGWHNLFLLFQYSLSWCNHYLKEKCLCL